MARGKRHKANAEHGISQSRPTFVFFYFLLTALSAIDMISMGALKNPPSGCMHHFVAVDTTIKKRVSLLRMDFIYVST